MVYVGGRCGVVAIAQWLDHHTFQPWHLPARRHKPLYLVNTISLHNNHKRQAPPNEERLSLVDKTDHDFVGRCSVGGDSGAD